MRQTFLKSITILTICSVLLLPIYVSSETTNSEDSAFCNKFINSVYTCLEKDVTSKNASKARAALEYCDQLGYEPFTRLVVREFVQNLASSYPRELICQSPRKYTSLSEIILKTSIEKSDIVLLSKYCSDADLNTFKSIYSRIDNKTRQRALIGLARENLGAGFIKLCQFLRDEGESSVIRCYASIALILNNKAGDDEFRMVLIDPRTYSTGVLNQLAIKIEQGWKDYFGPTLENSLSEVKRNNAWFQHVLRLLLKKHPDANLTGYFAKSTQIAPDLDAPLAKWLQTNNFPDPLVTDSIKRLASIPFDHDRFIPVNSLVVMNSLTGRFSREIEMLCELAYNSLDLELVRHLFFPVSQEIPQISARIPATLWSRIISDVIDKKVQVSAIRLKNFVLSTFKSMFIQLPDIDRLLVYCMTALEDADYLELLDKKKTQEKLLHDGEASIEGWIWASAKKEKVLEIFKKFPTRRNYLKKRYFLTGERWIENFIPCKELFESWQFWNAPGFSAIKLLSRHPKEVSELLRNLSSGCSYGTLIPKNSIEFLYGKILKTFSFEDFKLHSFERGLIIVKDFSEDYLLLVYHIKEKIKVKNLGRYGGRSLIITSISATKLPKPFQKMGGHEWVAVIQYDKRDGDLDGLTDTIETRMGLDFRKPDTDGDKILDGADYSPSIPNVPLEPLSWFMTLTIGMQDPWKRTDKVADNTFSIPFSIPIAIPFRQQVTTGKEFTLPLFDEYKGAIRFYISRWGVKHSILIDKDGIISCSVGDF